MTPGTRFWGRGENSSFSHFLAAFVGHSTMFWVSGTIFGGDVRTRRFHVFWQFSWAIAHCFWFRGRFSGPVTPVNGFGGDVKTRRFRLFCQFSWAIAHCFGFRGRFSGSVTTGTWFRGRCQNSSVSRFLTDFVGYSTLFWVPGTIFGARDPRNSVSGAT